MKKIFTIPLAKRCGIAAVLVSVGYVFGWKPEVVQAIASVISVPF